MPLLVVQKCSKNCFLFGELLKNVVTYLIDDISHAFNLSNLASRRNAEIQNVAPAVCMCIKLKERHP